jgi:hypothetical protein
VFEDFGKQNAPEGAITKWEPFSEAMHILPGISILSESHPSGRGFEGDDLVARLAKAMGNVARARTNVQDTAGSIRKRLHNPRKALHMIRVLFRADTECLLSSPVNCVLKNKIVNLLDIHAVSVQTSAHEVNTGHAVA